MIIVHLLLVEELDYSIVTQRLCVCIYVHIYIYILDLRHALLYGYHKAKKVLDFFLTCSLKPSDEEIGSLAALPSQLPHKVLTPSQTP